MSERKYPSELLESIPAIVFASLTPGEIRILLHPGSGMAQGGAPRDIPIQIVPLNLRMPNTPLWVKLDEGMNVVSVRSRLD